MRTKASDKINNISSETANPKEKRKFVYNKSGCSLHVSTLLRLFIFVANLAFSFFCILAATLQVQKPMNWTNTPFSHAWGFIVLIVSFYRSKLSIMIIKWNPVILRYFTIYAYCVDINKATSCLLVKPEGQKNW